MKSRIFLAAMMTAVLVMPATTALAADQDVDVHVLPADVLSIDVQDGIGLAIEVGESLTWPFQMDITNTTAGGWIVTVDGPDLLGYTCASWDLSGCQGRTLTGDSIPRSQVIVTGGDMCWGMGCDAASDSTITTSSGALGENPLTIMQGTAAAWGSFGFGPPNQPTVQVTIPLGSAIVDYYTTLTYTIMAPAP